MHIYSSSHTAIVQHTAGLLSYFSMLSIREKWVNLQCSSTTGTTSALQRLQTMAGSVLLLLIVSEEGAMLLLMYPCLVVNMSVSD